MNISQIASLGHIYDLLVNGANHTLQTFWAKKITVFECIQHKAGLSQRGTDTCHLP